MDTDSFVLSLKNNDIIQDAHNLRDSFDFQNLNKDHKLFSNENKKVVGKFKIETLENIWMDEFVCLRSKAFSYKCNNKNASKLKGISKSRVKTLNLMSIITVYLKVNIKKNLIVL